MSKIQSQCQIWHSGASRIILQDSMPKTRQHCDFPEKGTTPLNFAMRILVKRGELRIDVNTQPLGSRRDIFV